MTTVDEKLTTFKVVTGTDDGFATSFLEAHGWDVEAAVNSFIGGGGGRGAGGGSSSSDADKTPHPAPRRGKRPLETETSGNNKKLRVGDVCLGAVQGAGTTLVELLQPRPQHNAFNVLVPRAGHESRVFQQLVPVDALHPLPETAGQSVQLQTPAPVWLQRRGPSAYDTPVADVRATAVSYHGRQLTVTLNDFHDLEVSVPVKRVRLQFGEPSVLPPTRSSSDGKSRALSLVPRRPRLVAAVAVGTAAVVAGTALAGGLGFLWSWHAASTPVSASPALPHLPSLLGLMRCSSSCTSYQLGRARAAVGSLLGTLLSRFSPLFPSTHKCISDTSSLQDFHNLYQSYLSMQFTVTMFIPSDATTRCFLMMLKMMVLWHGAIASWHLRALTVLALILANAAAYLPLLDKKRQNLASVALRADNFSPARVLSACFAHANEEHLFNNLFGLIFGGLSLTRAVYCSNMLVLAVYAAAGVAGCYASAFFGPRHTYSVGASGAICGLRMAALALAGMDGALQSLVLWILSEVTNPRLGVDWNAHVGGGLCGFVFGSALSFLRMHLPTENEIARTLSLLAVLALLMVPVFHSFGDATPSEALRRMGTSRHQPRRASTFLQRVRHRSRTWGHRVSKRATRALKAKPLASCGLLLVGLLLLLAYALLPAAAESTCGCVADFPSFQQSLGCFSLPAAKAQLHAMPVYQSYLDAVTNATECRAHYPGCRYPGDCYYPECFTACQRAAKRVLLEVHPDKFAHSFGCLRADHSRFGIAHQLTLTFRGEANTACHARF